MGHKTFFFAAVIAAAIAFGLSQGEGRGSLGFAIISAVCFASSAWLQHLSASLAADRTDRQETKRDQPADSKGGRESLTMRIYIQETKRDQPADNKEPRDCRSY